MRLRVFGNRTIGRKQGQLGVAERPFIKDFDRTTPIPLLAVVDLAEVQSPHQNRCRRPRVEKVGLGVWQNAPVDSVGLEIAAGTAPFRRWRLPADHTTGELPTRPLDATRFPTPST